ncbi:MAG TPA: TfoX/Sxy family protein [Allosphingosinicella sp.]
MSIDEGLLAWVEEALEPIGRVSLRKMMGGGTLYVDGTIFAIMDDGELWFKADEESNPAWDGAGLTERFSVTFKDGTVDRMNYRRAPTDVHDDPEEMRKWARLALEAGARRPVKKRKPKTPKS